MELIHIVIPTNAVLQYNRVVYFKLFYLFIHVLQTYVVKAYVSA